MPTLDLRQRCRSTEVPLIKDQLGKIDKIWDECIKLIPSEKQHCERVEVNLEAILSKNEKIKLTDEECFILSVAACSHDIGKSRKDMPSYQKELHGEYSAEIIETDYEKIGIHEHYKDILKKIAKYHVSGDISIIKKHDPRYPIKLDKLAPLFKLADTIDSTSERISKSIIERSGRKYGDKEKARENMFSCNIDSNDSYKIYMTLTENAIINCNDLVQKAVEMMNDELKTSVIHLAAYGFPFWIECMKNEVLSPARTINLVKGECENFSKPEINHLTLKKETEGGDKKDIRLLLEGMETGRNKLLVMGDVMLDHIMQINKADYLQVTSHDVTHDFTFTKDSIDIEKKRFGGAANVAYCCAVFSEVILFGVIGSDANGRLDGEGQDMRNIAEIESTREITSFPKKIESHLVPIKNYLTVAKIYMKHNSGKKVDLKIRMNRELTENNGKKEILIEKNDLKQRFIDIFKQDINGIVFKDHQKGFLSQEFLDEIIPLINSKLANDPKFIVAVDPKYDWKKFSKIDTIHMVFPNIKEAAAGIYRQHGIEKDESEVEMSSIEERKKLLDGEYRWLANEYPNIICFVVKAAEEGASLYIPKNNLILDMAATHVKDVGDEIGCGDIFAAYFTNALLQKITSKDPLPEKEYRKFLRLANLAAGIKLTEPTSERIFANDIKRGIGIPRL